MNLSQLLTGLVDAAKGIEADKHLSDVDRAADVAEFIRVQAENLSVWLRDRQRQLRRIDEYQTNVEWFRHAADNLRPVCAAAAEVVWNIRQIDQRREVGE